MHLLVWIEWAAANVIIIDSELTVLWEFVSSHFYLQNIYQFLTLFYGHT